MRLTGSESDPKQPGPRADLDSGALKIKQDSEPNVLNHIPKDLKIYFLFLEEFEFGWFQNPEPDPLKTPGSGSETLLSPLLRQFVFFHYSLNSFYKANVDKI